MSRSGARSAPPVEAALEELRRRLGAELVAERRLPGETERIGVPARDLPPALVRALGAIGVRELWSHQAEALDAARAGENVLVTTATASGKSLIFQLPVLEEELAGGSGRALFLFPLKALGQDQRAKLQALATGAGIEAGSPLCAIYDGDTPSHVRARIRRAPPRVLITNPDMLHLGILPHAGAWQEFLAGLRWIVLDELHTYRGIFGAHFHHVLARLLRHARAAGARPSFVAVSATAAGADEFAEALAGVRFRWISESGAPREPRTLMLVRPAGSPYTTALDVFSTLIEQGQKTIAFTKARRITELLWTWLVRRDRELARRVRSYRAGFLPEERREIERRLFSGELDGVISTSALEMGIDVGGLDACVLVGYPGSVMATRQRSGRVGRSGRESATLLVALPDALDQYFLDHPDELVGRPLERLLVDPGNELVARRHLVCAAAERPLSQAADAALLERFAPLVGELLREGRLARREVDGELVATVRRPARNVSLRGTGASFAIAIAATGEVIGTVDGARVHAECHPGAIYLHAGRSWTVSELDLEGRHVAVAPADVDWYTTPLSEKETEIVEPLEALESPELRGGYGRLLVTERVVGFERRRTQGQEVLDRKSLELPPVRYEAHGFWFHSPPGARARFDAAGRGLLGGLHALEHAAIGLLPLLVLCDRNDLGGISLMFHPQLAGPGIFVYEGHAGGVGIARQGFRELPELLSRVRQLLERCPCDAGCPSCIQSPKCGNGNRPLDKAGALELATDLLAGAAGGVFTRPEPIAPVDRQGSAQESVPAGGGAIAVASPRTDAARDSTAGLESRKPEKKRGRAEGARRTVLFDVETLRSADEVGGWGKAHRMGVAVAVALHLEEGRFESFFEADVPALISVLKAADLVVGFNTQRFDYAVLSGYTGEDYRRILPSLDLLESLHGRLGYRVGLGHLARETLGADKSADGLQSLEWVREGRLDRVEEYCRHDVEILRDLYLFGRREGYVVISDRSAGRIRVEVDW